MKTLLIAVNSVIVLILLAACWKTIEIGIAEYYARLGTTEGLAQAVRIEPSNADYHRWLGITVLARDPQRSKREFQEAVRLNPWNADSRMRLGFLAESEGRLGDAERELLEARKFDNTFLPRRRLR